MFPICPKRNRKGEDGPFHFPRFSNRAPGGKNTKQKKKKKNKPRRRHFSGPVSHRVDRTPFCNSVKNPAPVPSWGQKLLLGIATKGHRKPLGHFRSGPGGEEGKKTERRGNPGGAGRLVFETLFFLFSCPLMKKTFCGCRPDETKTKKIPEPGAGFRTRILKEKRPKQAV